MEMDDTVPEVKTQWLNETLKFIKDDKELIYKYPEWPISRVKFYHALIAQRQLNAGLGFKTLYAPLWEAMKLFGLKYNFKVTIVNSKDEEKGSLVLEKIPKKTKEDTETDSEEEAICKQKLTKKMEQAYLLNKAIVERNSPTFIKNTLQSFLGFLIDETSASIDFKDLAPIEAKFIQNIQVIHDQKVLFYKIFSPSAIEILKKISTNLSLYKNTYNIKVGNVRTNPKTAKREITLIKEPNFGNPSSPLPSTMSSALPITNKKVISKPMSAAPLRTPKSINPKPISSFECVSSHESICHVDVSKTKPKEIDNETLNCKIKKKIQQANDKEIKETFEYKTGWQAKSRLINVEDISNNKSEKENSPFNSNKTVNKIACKINDKKKEENTIMRPETEGKREITLVKEPNFGNPSSPLPSTTPSTIPTNEKSTSKPMSPALLRTPKSVNPDPIHSFEFVSSHVDVSKMKPKGEDKETLNCKIRKEKQQADDEEIKETFEYKTGRQAKSRLINVEDISNNKTGKENSLSNADKTVNKIDCKINDNNKGENKITRPENGGKSTKIPEEVHGKAKDPAPADNNSKPSLTRSGQKRAMMEAMSKPLESDKGLRMMKLMGWEGGALGLRGNGIMEPITPTLLLKPKAGLGVPPVKISNKENKTEPKTKKATKETKNGFTRFQFLEGVYEALDKGNSIIHFKSSLNTREVRLYINHLLELNRRARVSHNCHNEKSMVDKILNKLHKMPDKMFVYSFMHNASELWLKVINKTDEVSMPQLIAPKVLNKTDGLSMTQPIAPKGLNKTDGLSMTQPIAPKVLNKTDGHSMTQPIAPKAQYFLFLFYD